jgi:hypothetical protein
LTLKVKISHNDLIFIHMGGVMVYNVHNVTFNNISAISWQSVLLVEEPNTYTVEFVYNEVQGTLDLSSLYASFVIREIM